MNISLESEMTKKVELKARSNSMNLRKLQKFSAITLMTIKRKEKD